MRSRGCAITRIFTSILSSYPAQVHFTRSFVATRTRRYWLTYAVASQREEWQACPKSVCRGGVRAVNKAVEEQVARAADALRDASQGA